MKKESQTLAQSTMDFIEARPRNYGPMWRASSTAKLTGPCGDTVEMWVRIKKEVVVKATFVSDGCVPSQRCCSAAARLIEGRRLDVAKEITPEQVLAAAAPIPEDHAHCALLAVNTIKKVFENFQPSGKKRRLRRKPRGIIGL